MERAYGVELSKPSPGTIVANAPAVQVTDVSGIVKKGVEALTGTAVSESDVLMDAGIDSLSAAELISTLAEELGIEIESTALFDHPTVGSLAIYLEMQLKSAQGKKQSKILPSLWSLYSNMEETKTQNQIFSVASKLTRRVVLLLAFVCSGSQEFVLKLKSQMCLYIAEDLCLLPFRTLEER